MKRAIVTGATGFVGSAVCRELVDQGMDVIAVVRKNDERSKLLKEYGVMDIVVCDLSEYVSLPDLINSRTADAFYHFAWEGSAGAKRADEDVQIKNIKYLCDAVRACAQIGCKTFVFASSVMEYEIDAVMKTESSPGINSLYCSAKLAANYMARTIAASFGINYIRGVISNIYGAGELSPRLINTSLRKLLNGERCSFSSGDQLYDFIYITDAAKAFYYIGERGITNRTYYIGSLNPQSLKNYLIEMRNCVNPQIEIGLGELPFNGISLSYNEFDIYAVKNDTGFEPQVSFSEGIRKTIDWIKKENDNGI